MNEMAEDSDKGGAAEVMGAAIAAMLQALVLLLMFAITVLARALQALFILARPALLFGSAAAAGIGAVKMFSTVATCYGGDLFAVMLALALTAIVPTSLILLAQDTAGLWPVLWAAAGLMMLAHFVISRAPPLMLASLPTLALSACVLYFAFDHNSEKEEKQNEKWKRIGPTMADHHRADCLHGEPVGAPDPEHPAG